MNNNENINKKICYGNHDKIVKIYKHLSSPNGKKQFNEKIKLLNDNKDTTLLVMELYWDELEKLIEILKNLSLNIINNRLSNDNIINYLKDLIKTLNKIDTPEILHFFTYKIINDKNFYNRIVELYEILNDKSKCIKLLKRTQY